MNILEKFKQRIKLGYSITEPLSKRGKQILEDDWNAGYIVIDAVLKAQKGNKKNGVIAEHVRLADEEYDLIQA